jgi:hypothetical protein
VGALAEEAELIRPSGHRPPSSFESLLPRVHPRCPDENSWDGQRAARSANPRGDETEHLPETRQTRADCPAKTRVAKTQRLEG